MTLLLPLSTDDGAKAPWPTVLLCLGLKCLPAGGTSSAKTENWDKWVTLAWGNLPSHGASPRPHQRAARPSAACVLSGGDSGPCGTFPSTRPPGDSPVCPRRHPNMHPPCFPAAPQRRHPQSHFTAGVNRGLQPYRPGHFPGQARNHTGLYPRTSGGLERTLEIFRSICGKEERCLGFHLGYKHCRILHRHFVKFLNPPQPKTNSEGDASLRRGTCLGERWCSPEAPA